MTTVSVNQDDIDGAAGRKPLGNFSGTTAQPASHDHPQPQWNLISL